MFESERKARRLYGKACRLGSGQGCHNLYICWRDGVGGPENETKAESYLERACKLRYKPACTNLGWVVPRARPRRR